MYSVDFADYDGGLEFHLEALSIREKLGNKRHIALSLNNIGVLYERLGDYDLALDYLDRALAARRELGIQHRIAGTLHNIGDIHLTHGDYDKALAHHREALAIRRDIGEKQGIVISLHEIAAIQIELGKLDLAEELLSEAQERVASLGNKGVETRNLIALAGLNRRRARYDVAQRQASRAVALAREMSANELLRRALRELAEAQEGAKRYRAALETYKDFKQVSETIFDEERASRIAVLERRYEAEKREREIEALKKDQAIQALELERQTTQRNILFAATLLVGGGGLWVAWRRAQASQRAEELSMTDPLTGLRNRRYLLQTIDTDVTATRRKYRAAVEKNESAEDADLLFMLIDIDHFKTVNDEFGHAAGDQVLVQFAALLKGTCRSADTVARWGGEEFLVLHRFANRRDAGKLAERIRASVAAYEFGTPEQTTRLTCSIGFAAFPFSTTETDAWDWGQVVGLADEALYVAKRSGRNAWLGLAASEKSRPGTPLAPERVGIETSLRVGDLKWRESI